MEHGRGNDCIGLVCVVVCFVGVLFVRSCSRTWCVSMKPMDNIEEGLNHHCINKLGVEVVLWMN